MGGPQTSQALATLSGPPAPDSATFARWAEGQRRRRLMEGTWKPDLKGALAREYDPTRRRLLGMPDTTKNLFRSLIWQLAVLYDRPPVIWGSDAVGLMRQITDDAGLWQMASTLQQNTLAQREGFYRFDVTADLRLLVRIVPTDLLWAEAPADDPDRPHTIHEYRMRETRPGRLEWTRDVLSIQDPDRPVYRVESGDGKIDLSDFFLGRVGGLSGDLYPYRSADGDPLIPGVIYHARRTGRLWDPFTGIELVDGTLAVAGLWTQWRHLVRDASWPQRWAINASVQGIEANRNGDLAVVTDPSTLLNFRPTVPGQSSTVGQFAPGGDPKELGDAIRSYAADLAQDFDLAPADIARTHVDARSGYAIEITREAQRTAQRRFEPQFKRGDLQSLSVIAALWNAQAGSTELPEDGWDIEYPGLPYSMAERKMIMEDHKMRAELGITSKPRLLAALEGMTTDQARERLIEMQADAMIFDASPAQPTQPTPDESE